MVLTMADLKASGTTHFISDESIIIGRQGLERTHSGDCYSSSKLIINQKKIQPTTNDAKSSDGTSIPG